MRRYNWRKNICVFLLCLLSSLLAVPVCLHIPVRFSDPLLPPQPAPAHVPAGEPPGEGALPEATGPGRGPGRGFESRPLLPPHALGWDHSSLHRSPAEGLAAPRMPCVGRWEKNGRCRGGLMQKKNGGREVVGKMELPWWHFSYSTDAVTEDGQILVYFRKEGLRDFVPPSSWEAAVKRTHQEKQQELHQ